MLPPGHPRSPRAEPSISRTGPGARRPQIDSSVSRRQRCQLIRRLSACRAHHGRRACYGMSERRGILRVMSVSPLWISSISALVVAVIGLVVQLRDRRLRWLDSPDRGRAQANLVSAWTAWGDPLDGQRAASVLVTNASKVAVYDVFIDLINPVTGVEERHSIGDVGPERTGQLTIAGPEDPEATRWEPRALLPRLYFQDLTYQRWLRDSVGRLRPDNEDGLHWNSLETEIATGPGSGLFGRQRRLRRP